MKDKPQPQVAQIAGTKYQVPGAGRARTSDERTSEASGKKVGSKQKAVGSEDTATCTVGVMKADG